MSAENLQGFGPAPPGSPFPVVLSRDEYASNRVPAGTVLGSPRSPARWVKVGRRLRRVCPVCFSPVDHTRSLYCHDHRPRRNNGGQGRRWAEYVALEREKRLLLLEGRWEELRAALPGTTEGLYPRFGPRWRVRRTRFYEFLKRMEREGKIVGSFSSAGQGPGRWLVWSSVPPPIVIVPAPLAAAA